MILQRLVDIELEDAHGLLFGGGTPEEPKYGFGLDRDRSDDAVKLHLVVKAAFGDPVHITTIPTIFESTYPWTVGGLVAAIREARAVVATNRVQYCTECPVGVAMPVVVGMHTGMCCTMKGAFQI